MNYSNIIKILLVIIIIVLLIITFVKTNRKVIIVNGIKGPIGKMGFSEYQGEYTIGLRGDTGIQGPTGPVGERGPDGICPKDCL